MQGYSLALLKFPAGWRLARDSRIRGFVKLGAESLLRRSDSGSYEIEQPRDNSVNPVRSTCPRSPLVCAPAKASFEVRRFDSVERMYARRRAAIRVRGEGLTGGFRPR